MGVVTRMSHATLNVLNTTRQPSKCTKPNKVRPLGTQVRFENHSFGAAQEFSQRANNTPSPMLRSSVHSLYPSHPTFKNIGEAPITRQSKEKMSHHPYQRRAIRPVETTTHYNRQYTISGQQENYQLDRDIIMRKMCDTSRTSWKQLGSLLNYSVKRCDTDLTNAILDKKTGLGRLVLDNDSQDDTIWIALEMGDVESATQLVCAGTDLDRRHYGTKATYLHWLASKVDEKYFKLATLMMDYGADVNASDNKDNSVLHVAAEFGLPALVEELVKRNANIDIVNKAGHSVVYVAAKGERAGDMLPLLIGYSGDLVTRNKRCIDAFYALTDLNAGYRQIKRLLDMGFPLDQYGRKGSTLLYEAVLEKKIDLVKLLLEYGADVNKKLRNGKLPLHAASQQKDPTIFKLLIVNGASVHDCSDDYNGQYPIHGACKHESLANINLLLRLGADVNVIDKNARTPFSLVPTENFTDLQACVIKYIAISKARENTRHSVTRSDLTKIRASLDMQDYYEKCLVELQKMKDMKVHENVSFFCLFEKTMIDVAKTLIKVDFIIKDINDFRQRLKHSFPVYYNEIQHLCRQVERAQSILSQKARLIKKIPCRNPLPDHVVDLIVFYSCLDEIKQMQRDYYISTANE